MWIGRHIFNDNRTAISERPRTCRSILQLHPFKVIEKFIVESALRLYFKASAPALPGTFAGSFLLNIWVGHVLSHHLDSTGLTAAVMIACASTLQAGVGGFALRRVIGDPAYFDSVRDLLHLFLLPPVFCLISATMSLAGLWLIGVVPSDELITNWLSWWIGDTVGVFVAMPLIFVAAGEPRVLWHSRAGYVAVPMALCFAIFVAMFARASAFENQQSLLQFRLESQRLSDKLRANLEEQAVVLEQLTAVFTTKTHILTRQHFQSLVQKLLQRFSTIQAVEWAPKVLPADRGTFEDAARSEWPGFRISQWNGSGLQFASVDGDAFYPITYVEPLTSNEGALGFDLYSERNRREAISGAIATGDVTASAPVRLVQGQGDEAGILLIESVPASVNGSGVVLVALRMSIFAGAVAEQFASTLHIRFADAGSNVPLFNSLASTTDSLYANSFGFGGRRYVVQTAPSAYYLKQERRWQSWLVLAGGGLTTALLGGLPLLGTGHTYRLGTLASKLQASESHIAADLRDMTRLHQLNNSLLHEEDGINYGLNEVLDTAIAISAADKGTLQLLNPETNALTIAAERGFDKPFLRFFERVVDDSSACGVALRSTQPVIVDDVLTSEIFARHPSREVMIEAGARAVISIPLRSSKSTLIGIISTHFAALHRPSERELRFLNLLARQTADFLERKQAEETEKTLLLEIQHRSNNLLAVVQSIAHRSLSGDHSLAYARERFEARLQALARANRQLVKSSWGGINLAEVVRVELEAYGDRTKIESSKVALGPQLAQKFALALHELATNAAKYGALSNSTGEVGVSWVVKSDGNKPILQFNWQETGGPPVSPPSRRGFGTALIEASFDDVQLEYLEQGLLCTIIVLLGSPGNAAVV